MQGSSRGKVFGNFVGISQVNGKFQGFVGVCNISFRVGKLTDRVQGNCESQRNGIFWPSMEKPDSAARWLSARLPEGIRSPRAPFVSDKTVAAVLLYKEKLGCGNGTRSAHGQCRHRAKGPKSTLSKKRGCYTSKKKNRDEYMRFIQRYNLIMVFILLSVGTYPNGISTTTAHRVISIFAGRNGAISNEPSKTRVPVEEVMVMSALQALPYGYAMYPLPGWGTDQPAVYRHAQVPVL